MAADGKGRFWAQYERAIAYFDSISKSKDLTRAAKATAKLGVAAAGVGANTGGRRNPTVQTNPQGASNAWVFADELDGTKHGGF